MPLFDPPSPALGRTRSQSHSSHSAAGGSPPSAVAHSPTASTSSLPLLQQRSSHSPVVQPLRVSSRRLSGDAVVVGPFTPAGQARQQRSSRISRSGGGGSVLDLTNSSQADLFTSPLVTSVPQPSSSSSRKRARDQPNGSPRTRPSQADPFAPTKPDLNPEGAPSLSTLTCPICLGPPTPLALTSCGHAFCAPCLHSALIAGPALTPPPLDPARNRHSSARTTSIRDQLLGLAGRPPAAAAGGSGAARDTPPLFVPNPRMRGAGAGGGGGRSAGTSAHVTDEEEEPGELDKRCPLCRSVLKGGWGRSLRGVTLRVLPRKVPALPPADLTDEDEQEEEAAGEGEAAKAEDQGA